MSRLTADQALEMVFMDDLDSGGELDIEEDPDFPLPRYSDSDELEEESDEDRRSPDPQSSDSDEDFLRLDTDIDGNLSEGKQMQ